MSWDLNFAGIWFWPPIYSLCKIQTEARLSPIPTEHYLYRQIPSQGLDGSIVTFILAGSSTNTNNTYILIFKKQRNISKFNNVKTVSLAFPKWVSKLLRGRVLLSSLWPLAPPHSNIVSTSSLQFSCANCSVVQLHTPANLSI